MRRSDDGRFVFHLGKREKSLLLEVLKLYPLIPEAYHLDRNENQSGTAPDEASQKLIAEALAEQRQKNKDQLRSMLEDPGRFTQHGATWHLSLSTAEVDWLLQVLNDIRVGSWIRLGSPDPKAKRRPEVTADGVPYFWAMELSGLFEGMLLKALTGD